MLLSVGHSVHSIDRFVALLAQHAVNVVADVRSQPFSAWQPQFNCDQLAAALTHHGVRYVPMGDQLGGRPSDQSLYDHDGVVSYARVAVTEPFAAGLGRLLEGSSAYRIAMMCSEADPADCHRHHLISRVLYQRHTVDVQHILADGSLAAYSSIPSADRRSPGRWQLPLFD
jgi:uncharacterized protein (DUF488 family)